MKTNVINEFKEFSVKNSEQIAGGDGGDLGDIDKDKIKMPNHGQE